MCVCVRIIYICTHVRLHEQYMVTLSMNDLYTNEQGKPVKKLTKMPSKTCTCDLHPNTGIRRTKFNLITLGSNSCLLGGHPKSIIKHIYIYSIYDSIYNYIYIILWLNQEYTRWRNVCSMQYNKDPLLIYCLFGKTHGQPHRAIGTSLDSPFCDSLTPKLLPTTIPNKLQLYPKNWTVSMPIPSCRCSSHAPESLNPSV